MIKKAVCEFESQLLLEFDDDADLHVVIRGGDQRARSVEIANPFGGGGNREIYHAALKLREAIQKHGNKVVV